MEGNTFEFAKSLHSLISPRHCWFFGYGLHHRYNNEKKKKLIFFRKGKKLRGRGPRTEDRSRKSNYEDEHWGLRVQGREKEIGTQLLIYENFAHNVLYKQNNCKVKILIFYKPTDCSYSENFRTGGGRMWLIYVWNKLTLIFR